MIERKTVLDQIEITRHGHVGIRLALLLVEDGTEIVCNWHRTGLTVESDALLQLAAVNSHLAEFVPPMPPVSDADIDRIERFFNLFRELAA